MTVNIDHNGHKLTNYTSNCKTCGETSHAVRIQSPHLDHWLYYVMAIERVPAKIRVLGHVWRFANGNFSARLGGGLNTYKGDSLCRALTSIKAKSAESVGYDWEGYSIPEDQKALYKMYFNL